MKTRFLVILTFLFFQRFGNTFIISSSNVTCIEKERQSLLVFKQTLRDRSNRLSTWSGVECCEWQGVECDSRNGHVVKLDLRSHGSPNDALHNDKWLKGELSPSLQNLNHLRYLDLSMNDFSGNIPEFFGLFEHLEYLNLSGSGFDGLVPHNLGNLSKLQYLDFKNYFKGEIFTTFLQAPIMDSLGWVSSLSALKYLDLSGISIGEDIDWLHPFNMLSSLHTLNLASCDINIPSVKFVNFTSLNSLDLSLNDINSTIPVWLSNLTSLVDLNLNENEFYGKIPNFIGVLSALASIDLSQNKFSGPIPVSIGLLLRLEDLYLGYNHLTGNIPMCLGKLSKLMNLDLSHNSLVGVVYETHFTKLKNLKFLALSSNSLELNLSSQWIAPFQLQIFIASSCNMNGAHFPKWLQTQRSLRRLDLSNSSIRDTMPEWFENILSHVLYLDLSNNQISGKLPRFHFDSSNLSRDGILRMNSNKFEGTLATFPSNVKILDLSDNLLSGHLPQADETKNLIMEAINLSKNLFSGSIPLYLCKATNIQLLDLSQNKFSGRLPECLGNLTSLIMIDLTNNTMTGILPSSLGSLKYLSSLHLHNNRFEGDIPVSLQNMTDLVTMDLGKNMFMGTIPFWIGEKLSNLRILNLGSNKFKGKIPLQICQLKALQYLSLAHNNITGMIPDCFRNFTGMSSLTRYDNYVSSYTLDQDNIWASMKGRELLYTKTIRFLKSLDISSNNIIGEIPNSLMHLVGLNNLNLSGNHIKGHIPTTIGDLKQLESLDLSINKLSGRIPQSLTSLNSLSYINLSFNNLFGPIPTGNQLQTLVDPSTYEGNNGLCGPPVLRSCNQNDVTYHQVDVGEYEGRDDIVGLWFYAGMGPGFVVGFMGLLGSLHFISRWRVAYFKMLENVYGWITLSILLNLARLRRKVSK